MPSVSFVFSQIGMLQLVIATLISRVCVCILGFSRFYSRLYIFKKKKKYHKFSSPPFKTQEKKKKKPPNDITTLDIYFAVPGSRENIYYLSDLKYKYYYMNKKLLRFGLESYFRNYKL